MHGLSLKTRTQGVFDWEVAASHYDYRQDHKRQNAAANVLPAASGGGAGTLADGSGTGWTTLALRGTWRPEGRKGPHIVDFGVQQDSYRLAYRTSAVAGNWLADPPGAIVSDVGGRSQLRSLWAQDAWSFAPGWKAVLGARLEHWSASSGFTRHSRRGAQHRLARAQRNAVVAQAGAVLAVAAGGGAEGLARPGRAFPDGGRAVRRHADGERTVHQRPEPQARTVLDHRTERRKGPGQWPGAR